MAANIKNRYEHLELKESATYDWYNEILIKTVPKKLYTVNLFGNFLLGLNEMYSSILITSKEIRTRMRV